MVDKEIMDIKIKGFNSIKSVDLCLREGVTVVTGPSNVGKSSIIKGIYQLIYNPSGTKYINSELGKTEMHIKFCTGDKKTYTFKRSNKGSTVYEVDGRVYEKVNGQLEELENIIPKGNEVNFWLQNSSMYLIGESPKSRYDMLFSGVDYETTRGLITEDQKRIKQSIRDNEVQTNLRQNDIERLNLQVLTEEKRVQMASFIEEIETKQNEFNRLYGLLNGLNSIDKGLKLVQSEVDSVRTRLDGFNTIESIDNDINHIEILGDALSRLNGIYTEIKGINSMIDSLGDEIHLVETDLQTFKVCPLCGGELHE